MKQKLKKSMSITMVLMIIFYSLNIMAIPAEGEVVTPLLVATNDASAMVDSLLSDDFEYVVSNAQFSGVSGTAGTFSGAEDLVGFDSGIALSTGLLTQNSITIFQDGYDVEFDSQTSATLPSGKTYLDLGFPSNSFNDLSMLSFDVTADEEGMISFQYCVASEEYPEYIKYADQFVLRVNGVNYAIIPETSTPVSIGTINQNVNTIYYKGLVYDDDSQGAISTSNFIFDGKTVVFSVSAPVSVGVNNIELSIADFSDKALDSAVFIKAKSIKSRPAIPGVYGIGEKEGTDLNINRNEGTDGFSQVTLTFKNVEGGTISTSVLDYSDGESTKKIAIPLGAYSATISNANGGASIDPENATKILIEAAQPVVNNPVSLTKNIGNTATFSVTASVTDGGSLTYQWQKNTGSDWADISGATENSYTTGTLSYEDNGAQYRCVVTNAKNETVKTATSSTATLTINPEAVAPVIKVQPVNISEGIDETVIFKITAESTDDGTVTYQWQKYTKEGWSDISGATEREYVITSVTREEDDTKYRCIVVNSKNETSKSLVSKEAELAVGATVKAVEKRIDELIDPDKSTDEEIIDNQGKITDTKKLYDDLTNSERSTINEVRKTKLNKLIERLNAALVIKSKDEITGIEAQKISTSVLLPELNDENVSKVFVKLDVQKVSESEKPASVEKAFKVLSDDKKELVATYELSLIKTIYDLDNQVLSSGKISNSQIVDYISIQIPIPEGYEGREDLTVIYIDDEGNITPLETTIVTVDGVKYLEFKTNHFSQYAVTASVQEESNEIIDTEQIDTGDRNDLVVYFMIMSITGIISFSIISRKNKKTVYNK